MYNAAVAITPWFHLCFNFLSRYQYPKEFLPLYFKQFLWIFRYHTIAVYIFDYFLSKRKISVTKCSAWILQQWSIFGCHHAAMLNFLWEWCGHGPFSVRMMQLWSVFSKHDAAIVKSLLTWCSDGQFSVIMMLQQSIFCVPDAVKVSFLQVWWINGQFSIRRMKRLSILFEFSAWS